MNPFEVQAKLAGAWLDAASAGLAVAGSIGSATAKSMRAWNGAATPFTMNGWPMLPAASYMPWWTTWGALASPASYASPWGFPMPFSGGDWIRLASPGSTMGSWPFAGGAGMASFPAWDFLSAFAPLHRRSATPFWPWPQVEIDVGWPVMATYRTASGHAAAAFFNGFDAASRTANAWPDMSRAFFTLGARAMQSAWTPLH